MSTSAVRHHLSFTLPASLLALGAAVLLGLAVGGSVPGRLVLPAFAVVPAVLGLVVLLLPSRQVLPYMAGVCILATTLASSTLPVARLLGFGRFVFPALLLVLVAKSGIGSGASPAIRRLRAVGAAVVCAAGLSILTSKSPGLSALKALSLALVLASVIALVQWSAAREVSLRRPVLFTLAALSISNLLVLPLGGRGYSGSRFRGWTINPNTLGILCALAIPVLVAEVVASKGRRRQVLLVAVAVVTVTLLLSGSRGGALAAALGTAAVLRSARVTRSVTFPIIAVALLALAPWALQSGSQSGLLEGVERTGNSGRDDVWPIAVAEVKHRPFTGAGFATTEGRFAQAEFGQFSTFQGGHFHNSYLEAAVELGVLGALPVILVGLFSVFHLVRRVPPESIWAAGMAVAGASIAVFETGALTAGAVLFFPFWLAIGVLVTSAARPLDRSRPLAVPAQAL